LGWFYATFAVNLCSHGPQRALGIAAMFVRWQHYGRQDGTKYWNAALVTVARINNKPTQKHLAALGGIAEADADNVAACHDFWTKALKRLATRKLSKAERQKIETALAARVKRPTSGQLRRQQVLDLKKDLELAQQRVLALKAELRNLRGAE
jgi:hypothetical protein